MRNIRRFYVLRMSAWNRHCCTARAMAICSGCARKPYIPWRNMTGSIGRNF
ncbi:hypothetical protein EVA_20540 [gut metagenome]|uniref:Uncharacterized protein n=1 Tax=gut metagenome TaxID=749906 RepID=J9BUU8_9ZZZZ